MPTPRAGGSPSLVALRLVGFLLLFRLAAGTSALEDNLIATLLNGYVKEARPPPSDAPTVAYFSLYLLSINGVEEHLNTISVAGNMISSWNDPRLVWNTSQYGGLDRVTIAASELWKPDMALTDAVGDVFNEAYFSDYYGLTVKSAGEVTWAQLGSLDVRCDFDLTYYPFDVQTCDFEYSSFNYPSYLLHIDTNQSIIDLDGYHENAEFTMINTSAYTSFVYIPGDGNYSKVVFQFSIKRRELYFMLNLILPCVLLTLLTCFLFLLPTSSEERVGLSVTVMLSYSVFQLLVSQNLPMNSLCTPLLTMFILVAMFVNGFSLVLTIFILRTATKGNTPMPAWVEKYLLNQAGVFFGLTPKPRARVSSARSSTQLLSAVKVIETLPEQKPGSLSGSDKAAFDALLSSVMKIERSLVKREERENIAHKWQLVSKVIDVILFILFTTYNILFCIGTMVIMPAQSN